LVALAFERPSGYLFASAIVVLPRVIEEVDPCVDRASHDSVDRALFRYRSQMVAGPMQETSRPVRPIGRFGTCACDCAIASPPAPAAAPSKKVRREIRFVIVMRYWTGCPLDA
jgi:hypothetical protein